MRGERSCAGVRLMSREAGQGAPRSPDSAGIPVEAAASVVTQGNGAMTKYSNGARGSPVRQTL